jgi:biopolymer transport protein TolR
MSFGRFAHKDGAAPMSDINMTPLIDVMLVLLVIFIITAPLMLSAIQVELPRDKASAAAQSETAPLAVTIAKDGAVYIQEEKMADPDLLQALQAVARRNPDTELALRADVAVPYGAVVAFMAQAHQAGLHRIGFVTEKQP